MATVDEVMTRKLEESNRQHIQEYFDRAEIAKQIPGKMLEQAILSRFIDQLERKIQRIAKEYEAIDGEDFPRSQFADVVGEVYEAAWDELMQEYNIEYRNVLYEAFPDGLY